MLGLVTEPRLATQGHQQQGRHPERPVERGERVDRVAQPRILTHHHGRPASQPSARRDANGFALAGGPDITDRRRADNAVQDRRQERAGNSGVEVEPPREARREKTFGLDHPDNPGSLPVRRHYGAFEPWHNQLGGGPLSSQGRGA